ncbi:MAG: glycosyltransferase [Gemmataceae bacterium]|nr:glycosyltransferase [Gemmataceae bacterium]MDW8265430.1 glycosyltransferase [Gemmataceae bacterium]
MRVSLTMIVKNEEADLPGCLESVADLVDDIVVIDTGSTDRTKEVAARYGARVFDFTWIDHFAAARNEGIKHAVGDWIFWMDADDRLDADNRGRLKQLFAGLRDELAGYMMKCVCRAEGAAGGVLVLNHMRLFRKHPEVRWQYRVHELIRPALQKAGGITYWTDVVIQHTGYQSYEDYRRKVERNLRLLTIEHAEEPNDPFILCNLGRTLMGLKRPAEAIPYLRRSLELSPDTANYLTKLYVLIGQGYAMLGQKREALAVTQEGRARFPDDSELLFREAALRLELGDLPGAEACLLELLRLPPEATHTIAVDPGLRGYKARHNLAIVYHRQGRFAEAEAQWNQVLAERPDYLEAWMGAADLLLSQKRVADVERLIGELRAHPQFQSEAAMLQARLHQERREFASARALLEGVIARQPTALGPRVALSQVLLQEGRDLAAAERALLAVLELDPGYEEARRSLALLRQTRRPALAPGSITVSW